MTMRQADDDGRNGELRERTAPHLKRLTALERLSARASVTEAAFAVGYATCLPPLPH